MPGHLPVKVMQVEERKQLEKEIYEEVGFEHEAWRAGGQP